MHPGMMGTMQHRQEVSAIPSIVWNIVFAKEEVRLNYSLMRIYKAGRHLVALYCSRKLVRLRISFY